MAKPPPKLSGLLKSGAVVPSESEHAQPDTLVRRSGQIVLPSSSILDRQATPSVSLETGASPQLVRISVHLIDQNSLATREVYEDSVVQARAEAIITQGQHDPIHVIPNPDAPGRYIISDGWTRVKACLEYGAAAELNAFVHTDLSLTEAAWFGYEQNEEREPQSEYDKACFFRKLLNQHVDISVIKTRGKFRGDRSAWMHLMAFTELPLEVREVIESNKTRFGSNAAYQLLRIHKEAGARRAKAVADAFATEGKTYRWLLSQADAVCIEGKQRPRTSGETWKAPPMSNGRFKVKGPLFELQISVEDAQKHAEFLAALKELVSKVAVPVTAVGTDHE